MSEGPSDESLMFAYQAGDTSAFERLMLRHERAVYNFIRRQIGESRADDLLQDVFLRIVKASASYEKQAKFTTWMYTIARNLCVDALRRGAHRRTESLDETVQGDDGAGTPRIERVADTALGTEGKVMGSEIAERLEEALRELPEEQREVFLLREREDLSFAEIAQITGVPENTVKSRMRYALERLRRELADMREVARAAQ